MTISAFLQPLASPATSSGNRGRFTSIVVLVLFLVPVAHAAPNDTARVANAYFDAILARDLETAIALSAEDILFIDPTTDIFEMPLATGVRGRDEVLAVQQGFPAAPWQFHETLRFITGDMAVFLGELGLRINESSEGVLHLPWSTILRIQDGKVVERRDYGRYDIYLRPKEHVGAPESFSVLGDAGEENLRKAARHYFDTQTLLDFESLGPLFSEDAVFVDPTSRRVGPEIRFEGRDAIVGGLTRAFDGIQKVEFDELGSFFSNEHAVFAVNVRARYRGDVAGRPRDESVHAEFPMVTVLRLREGLVVEHRDYADYETLLQQLLAPAKGSEAGGEPTTETSATELREQAHRLGMEALDFLVGSWNGSYQQFRNDSWTEASPMTAHLGRTMHDKYIEGEVVGGGYWWVLSYDQVQEVYRMSSRDQVSGLLDIYEGLLTPEGLVVSNVGPGTHYLQGETKVHNRLVFAPREQGGFSFLVDGSGDEGHTWSPVMRMTFDTPFGEPGS